MKHIHSKNALGHGIAAALACAVSGAHAEDTLNTLKIGYAYIAFDVKSGDLTGPAGTTPPGVQASLKDTSTPALAYERTISGPWSVIMQVGAPPVIKLYGAGTGSPLGEVGTVRAWFPAVLAQYTFNGPWGTLPYIGAGANYTFYNDSQVSAAFTTAFGGTSSTAKMSSAWGPVLKVGLGFPVSRSWVVDAAYSHYGIKTTATITTVTPGVGDIAREIDVQSNPDVFSLTVGYRF